MIGRSSLAGSAQRAYHDGMIQDDYPTLDGRPLSPESLMMSYGYDPHLSEGAVKPPIFQTSTFVFRSAEEGKAFFEIAMGERPRGAEPMGLIYSRLNNPNLEILEDRLTLWDRAEACAVFSSGMSAIATTLFYLLNPGDVIVHSEPLYGGTDYLIKRILPRFGIGHAGFRASGRAEDIQTALAQPEVAERVALIFVETPANPTNALVDIGACVAAARVLSTPTKRVRVAVDNTFLGPLFQHPLQMGADLVLYSATKFIGGHSDLIAGACLGPADLIDGVKGMRLMLGTMADAHTSWLLLRSLETLKVRMEAQAAGACRVAHFLARHPKVERVYYPGLLEPSDAGYAIFKKQCLSTGSMVTFNVRAVEGSDGEAEAFRFLNALQLFHLAVSLGGTESLAEHPYTMTHADVALEDRLAMDITPKMVRLSIGLENPDDLIADLEQALRSV